MEYCEGISPEDYNRLREEVKWGAVSNEQAQNSINNSAYVVSCRDNGMTVASARVLWDGGTQAYICDVMVSPDHQLQGIGRELIQHIMTYLRSQMKDGWKVFVSLMAAKGKETFYSKLGFTARPTDILGPGLTLWLTK